jgi:hypothetical protein
MKPRILNGMMICGTEYKMRYRDTGELHRDFHLGTNTTIDFIMEQYGPGFLLELCRRTTQKVYKDIYQQLQQGNSSALIEHLQYYLGRESGVFEINTGQDQISVNVSKCPMLSHITSNGEILSPGIGDFLSDFYGSWGENTPFTITVDYKYPDESYCIYIRRNYAS